MIELALITVLTVQSVPPPAPAPAYIDPPVRPFEPTGPLVADGVVPTPAARVEPTAPVTVEAYQGQYETPALVERLYAEGVAQAEASMDSRMGPLDGRWRVVETDGRTAFTLVLNDDGSGGPVEGAWRDMRGRMGAVGTIDREEARAVLVLDGRAELRLSRTAQGFEGRVVEGGADRPVRLVRD